MNKKRIILISIATTVLLIILLFSIFRNEKGGNITDDGQDVFLFDSSGNRIETGGNVGGGSGVDNGGVGGEITDKSGLFELRKITQKETSGYGLFGDGGTTTIRYVDTESGNIFEANSNSLDIERVTNTTILQTIDSLWLDRDLVVLRYVDESGDIQTFSAEIIEDGEGGVGLADLEGVFLKKNIKQIDVFNNKIFALLEDSFGLTGVIYSPDLEKESVIWNTPLKEVWGMWADNNTIAINTKPSAQSSGYLFFLNTNSGSLSTIISEEIGLSSNVSQNTQNILYNTSQTKGVSLWFLDKKTNTPKRAPKNTLAEKCAWADQSENIVYCAVPQNTSIINLPDEWYKGNVSFSDDIWKINLDTNEVSLIAVLEDGVDVIKIKVSKNEDYLVFVNKRDVTLWGIKLWGD